MPLGPLDAAAVDVASVILLTFKWREVAPPVTVGMLGCEQVIENCPFGDVHVFRFTGEPEQLKG